MPKSHADADSNKITLWIIQRNFTFVHFHTLIKKLDDDKRGGYSIGAIVIDINR